MGENPPDYIVAAFDRKEKTFRKEIYNEYKAHRPELAKELISQLIRSREVMENLGITVVDKAGFEADDIIGTLAKKFKDKNHTITILTGDLDALQLVNGKQTVVKTFKKGVSEATVYDEEAVVERYGVSPLQITDFKGFVGDASDNIPGVKGVGPKTASEILQKYGSLEKAYEALKKNPEKKFERILGEEASATLSKKLATIDCDVPIEVSLENLKYKNIRRDEVKEYVKNLGFESISNRIEKLQKTVQKPQKKNKIQKEEKILFIENETEAIKHKKLLTSEDAIKISFNWKEIIKKIKPSKIEVKDPLFDLKVAAWMINPGLKDYPKEDIINDPRIAPKNFQGAYDFYETTLTNLGVDKLFYEVEMPLIRVLADMETWGIKLNSEKLHKLQKEIEDAALTCEKKIKEGSGQTFNLNSPKQVGHVLFEVLGLKTKRNKKTPGGELSTNEAVLKELAEQNEIPKLLLEYREHTKIKSTYIDPLLELAKKEERIHTSFSQTGTATGRISSEKPNLQNIPQESQWSKKLRETFESEKDWSFLSFDYSQLELRLLAAESDDPKMKKAFQDGKDIHTSTAASIFKVNEGDVTPQMRRIAKTLNFGIVYGMGARSFSETSGLTFEEARKFIGEYFSTFAGIHAWQEKVIEETKKNGYVKNKNGRIRLLGGIDSSHPRERSEAERAATNMPIQSLEADILKLAMIQTHKLLQVKTWLGTKAKPLLTIHDELLFEIKDDILNESVLPLQHCMEKTISLTVPLRVEPKIGKNWGNMSPYKT